MSAEDLTGDAAIAASAAGLAKASLAGGKFECGNDGFGYFWAITYPVDCWLSGPDTLESLRRLSTSAADGPAPAGF